MSILSWRQTARAEPANEKVQLPGYTHARICPPGDAQRCVIYLEVGEKAPFAGPLLMPIIAAEQAVMVKGFDDRLNLAVKATQDVCDIREKGFAEIAKDEVEGKEKEINLWKKAASDAAPSWYERPAVVIPVTLVLAVAVVWAASQLVYVSVVQAK